MKTILITAALATCLAFAQYPVTIENCGNTLSFDEAPERGTESLLGHHRATFKSWFRERGNTLWRLLILAKSYPTICRKTYQNLNLIGEDFVISREVTLSYEPDLVMDNQPDWFYTAENGFATVEDIQGVGGQTYTVTAKCDSGRLDATFEDNYTDLRNMGKLFAVEDRAESLIAEMQSVPLTTCKRALLAKIARA